MARRKIGFIPLATVDDSDWRLDGRPGGRIWFAAYIPEDDEIVELFAEFGGKALTYLSISIYDERWQNASHPYNEAMWEALEPVSALVEE